MAEPTSPEDRRATETARRLITAYLADDLNVHAAIRETMRTESTARLCRLLWVLVGAVGDTFDSLDDYRAHIVDSLGSER